MITPEIAMGFNPQTKLEDLGSILKSATALQGARDDHQLRQQQVQQSQAQTQNLQAEAAARDQAVQDNQSWTRILRQAGGDADEAFKMAATDQSGPSAKFLAEAKKGHSDLVDSAAKRRTEDITADDKTRARIQNGVSGIMALPDADQPLAFKNWMGTVRSDPETKKHIDTAVKAGALPEQYDKDALTSFNAVLTGAKGIAEQALAKQNLVNAKTVGEKDAAEAWQKSLLTASQTVPQSVADTDARDRWYVTLDPKVQKLLGPVDALTDEKLAWLKQSAVPVEKQPEYLINDAQFKGMKGLTVDQIGDKIAALIPKEKRDASAIKAFTARAQQAVNSGDLKSYNKVLDEAVRYSTGIDKTTTTNIVNLQNKEGIEKANGATPEAIMNDANQFLISGLRPPSSLGDQRSKNAFKNAVEQRQRELGITAGDVALQHANYKAQSASLSNLEKMQGTMEAAEGTAGANLDMAVDLFKKLKDTRSPLLNKPLRALDRNVLGGVDQAAVDAAMLVATTETAKVLSQMGAGGGGVLTEGARHEAQSMLDPSHTLNQILGSADVLRKDMNSRKVFTQNSINKAQNQLQYPHWDKGNPGSDDARYVKGKVYNGMKYNGGDVSKESNWEKVSQ